MTDALIVVNAGSSSLRCALYSCVSIEPLCRVHIEAIGESAQRVEWSGALKASFSGVSPPAVAKHATLIRWLLQTLCSQLPNTTIVGAGHRVVHGGAKFAGPVLIDNGVMQEIERLAPLAPNHQPHAIAAIQAIAANWAGLPQVACFDTAFHRQQPRLAQLFALPRELSDAGVLRYGFHGLSYEYLLGELAKIAGPRADGRVILAHLGHGASLCALHHRRSVATTMGFTALDGLMMGTRCGELDPGVVLHLQQAQGFDIEKVADLLYNRSGLLGVSGISDDLRVLETSDDPHAREAIELFAYRAAREIGSLAAALGGLETLVFSGGIGERSAQMRKRICEHVRWLGANIDDAANASHQTQISDGKSTLDVFVIPTDEEIVIAGATQALTLTGRRETGS